MHRRKKIYARSSAKWVRRAIIYEVYFRSFTPEGTIKSALIKLPLLRSLGVNVLWLMPIHPIGIVGRKGTRGSPYAVKDYFNINPEYGTLNDLRYFLRLAHKRGFRVIMDLVIGHAAWDNPLLLMRKEWFRKKNGEIIPPKQEWFDVAAFDYRKKELRSYMIHVMKFWSNEIGFDGFRCDAAESLPLGFWEKARHALEKIKPVMMISESDRSPSHHRKAFDLSYSTPLYRTLVTVLQRNANARNIEAMLNNERKRYPKNSLLLRFTSNHDRNVEDGSDIAVFGNKGAMLAAAAINMLPGIPMLYNGQEFGSRKQLSLFDKITLSNKRNKKFYRLYQKLFALRKKYAALTAGKLIFLQTSQPKTTLAFARVSGKEKLVVVMNCSKNTVVLSVNFSTLLGQSNGNIQCRDLFAGKYFKIQLNEKKSAEFNVAGLGWKIIQFL